MSAVEPLRYAYRVAESIASRDKNNLYLTSRFFTDRRRYDAFCALYAPMRVVDDRVDDVVAATNPGSPERARVAVEVDAWANLMGALCAGGTPAASDLESAGEQAPDLSLALRDAQAIFPIPWRLWDNFFTAMRRDLEADEFDTFAEFLNYAEGATVAPTTIYLILLAASPGTSDRFELPPGFDAIECGRNLGLFAYLVHILRDLPEDLAAGRRGLCYLAREDLARFGIGPYDLRRDLATGRASDELRRLLAELGTRAERYLAASDDALTLLFPRLAEDCAYVLSLIVDVYREILARLAAADFDPFLGRQHLSLEEKEQLAERTGRRLKLGQASGDTGLR